MGVCPKCGKATAGGSVLQTSSKPGGVIHQTSYNSAAGVHFSQDVLPSGKVVNRHWTDHSTNAKIGDRDK